MQIRELEIADAYEITPTQHRDERGLFLESYRADVLQGTVGYALDLKQSNVSVSVRGTFRGIHYALVPPGQAKYITVTNGEILDYVTDLRVGSPTFGETSSVVLNDVERKAVYIGEGLGHAFLALSAEATVTYFVSEFYAPTREFALNPTDPDLGLVFPEKAGSVLLSDKDRTAMGLVEAKDAGLLPTWSDCQDYYARLKNKD